MSDAPLFPEPWPARDGVRITRVRAFVTSPEGIPLVVVRVETSDPGLYGLGCATFTQRFHAVVAYLEEHVERLVVGRHPADIEDLLRLVRFSGYWREGPVGNSVLAGLDMALWDIAGKRAQAPVFELLGGRVRAAADTYTHAEGATISQTIEHAAQLRDRGYRHVRIQTGQPGLGNYGAPPTPAAGYPGAPTPTGWVVEEYLLRTVELFREARSALGERIELLHDCHSRLTPAYAVRLARSLESAHPYFLEDVLAPEHWSRLPEVRAASPVPLAVGELAVTFADAARLVTEHAVDYLRCHVSLIGGVSAARRLSVLAELEGIRTAWHTPGDASPIAVAANVTLDVTSPAFGIQEVHEYDDRAREVFPGTLVVEDGWLRPSLEPGWGIDFDEAAARRYPAELSRHDVWAAGVRAPDGGLLAP